MKNNKGFSLVELIVVIAIMAILAAVAIPTFAHFIQKANLASDQSYLNDLKYAVELALASTGEDYTGYELTVSVTATDAVSYTYTRAASGTEGDDDYVAAKTHTFTEEQNEAIAAVVSLTHDFKSIKEDDAGTWKIGTDGAWAFSK